MSFIAEETQRGTKGLATVSELLDESSDKSVGTELPDNLFLHIFSFLSPKEVLLAGEVCRNWHRLSKDEMLWKFLLQETLNSGMNKVELSNSSTSWLSEFQRIHSKTPFVESQVLKEHTDEVLHVAFSHDGQLFASSSKDCSVILWRVSNCDRVCIAQKINFQEYNWEYVQFCEFNASDTLLLVSGVNKFQQCSFRGEIFVCELQGSSVVALVHRISNEPYDVFGAWLTESCYISGKFEFQSENDRSSVSELWANCVDEWPGNQTSLARVVNHNASSVRTVLVARPRGGLQRTSASAIQEQDDHICLIFTHGTVTYVPHQIVFKWLRHTNGTKTNQCQNGTRKHSSHKGQEEDSGAYQSFSSESDRCIETNAHIIGMSLSPDHEYLYVNCRQWEKQDGKIGYCQVPPEISKDISLQVYSLTTYKLVDVHVGHQAHTPNDGCFFIFLNVADNLVASGAEDHCAHVWDRHFGTKLATLKGHTNVVNCVAFNPVNGEMLVSASDDHTIRVWRSRQLSKLNPHSNVARQSGEVSFVDEGIYRETTV